MYIDSTFTITAYALTRNDVSNFQGHVPNAPVQPFPHRNPAPPAQHPCLPLTTRTCLYSARLFNDGTFSGPTTGVPMPPPELVPLPFQSLSCTPTTWPSSSNTTSQFVCVPLPCLQPQLLIATVIHTVIRTCPLPSCATLIRHNARPRYPPRDLPVPAAVR